MEVFVAEPPLLSSERRTYPMKGETKEAWLHYCEQAAIEQDRDKLLALVNKINRMLEEKENRLQRRQKEQGR